MSKGKLKIGILGGGFAGLYTALYLQKHMEDRIDLTLFDRNNYLLYTPVLHEMATGTINARHIVIPIRRVIAPWRVHFRCEAVILVDLAEKTLETRSGRFTFDYLVLAQGSESNFYSITGARENSITFKTIEDAIRLRNTIIHVLEKAALEKHAEKRKNLLTISVAGGGCTGVEVAAEIAQFVNTILAKDYPEIKRSDVRIILIEALDKILPSFPVYLSGVATQRLKQMGVEVLLNSPIQQVNKELIYLKDGRSISNGLLVWAAGVKGHDLCIMPDIERDKSSRIRVNERLEILGYPATYAIGDGAHVLEKGTPLPPTASVAVQEARYVAETILSQIQGKDPLPFSFHYRGDMASLGFMSGVAEIYGRHFRGAFAWFIWKIFKLTMLPRYKNRFQILGDWLITLLFKRDTSNLM